jgi:opacity protein-like surface antigen
LFTANGTSFESRDVSHDGAYVGGGVDWAFWNGWVAGLEYRHDFFEAQTVVPTLTATGAPHSHDTWQTRPDADAFTFRLSYLFDWAAPPAKY